MPSSFIDSCHYRRVQDGSLIPRFRRARRDPALAVLEGLHPLKHALRFGANVLEALTRDVRELERLAAELAPDLSDRLRAHVREIDPAVFDRLAPLAPSTGVIALAERPRVDPDAVLADRAPAPVIVLEDPRDLGNMGACVRVAAAASAAGVLSIGGHDPWHPDALRGAAGLHFAMPVARLQSLAQLRRSERPLLALDPHGEPIEPSQLPARAVLAFGTERRGLSRELLAGAGARVSIPMRPGVSSLNLATSVAAVLFAWRLSARPVPALSPLA
jgi:RNA methyltransferase, TrmH family